MAVKKKAKAAAKPAERAKAAPRAAHTPVVGIGASAGGLDAFKKFFAHMPANSGIAFVLVPHLDPQRQSLMVELLARHCTMPVVQAEQGMPVLANRVHVIPPNKYMTISGNVLQLQGPVERRSTGTAIDPFLRSLAEDREERAICIILSGTGPYGSPGLRAVKAQGGLALVQDPVSAEYSQMPQTAVATGLADYVLPPQEMPAALLDYVQHAYGRNGQRSRIPPEDSVELKQIIELLGTRTRYGFECYRKAILWRRIEQRMSLHRLDDVAAYLALLRERPDEASQLARALFTHASSFFRDPEVFEFLETQVLAPLVRGKEAAAAVRVWVPGCASGEEAYSLAMLLLEQLAAASRNCRLQIFASDVDPMSLETARRGIFPETIGSDVSAERLQRFFTRIDAHHYQVVEELREAVIFARQDVLSDPPFSHLDLVSCRNLLTFLEPETQKRVLSLLHFALNSESGYLLLGHSEMVGPDAGLFQPVSKKWRIYRRTGPSQLHYSTRRRPTGGQERPALPDGSRRRPMVPAAPTAADASLERRLSNTELARQLLLQSYAPAAVLLNRDHQIIYSHGPVFRYLGGGEPPSSKRAAGQNLDTLFPRLQDAVQQAARDRRPVIVRGLRMQHNGTSFSVRMTVKPVRSARGPEGLLLVTFADEDTPRTGDDLADDDAVAVHLHDQLQATRQELEGSLEELAGANEELTTANEEVMSVNEQLQATNEELAASQQELQTLIEELNSLNGTLQQKVDELERSNADLMNLLSSTDVAAIFLDTSGRIRRFTPASTRLLRLISTDIGRPLTDIAQRFADPDLALDIHRVLDHPLPIEKEIRTDDGRWYLRRALPYFSTLDEVAGTVITFIDVTPVKRAADQEQRLAAVLRDSNDAVTVRDVHGRITAWNRSAERMYGYREAEALGMHLDQLVPADFRKEAHAMAERLLRGGDQHSWETRRLCKDGKVLDVWLTATVLYDAIGRPTALATTERDITERKRSREELEARVAERTAELQTANANLQAEIEGRLELEKEVLAIAAREQRRIGQDLHDGIGQELTGLSLMAQTLLETLQQQGSPAAANAGRISERLRQTLDQARRLCRGLIPVEVDAEGLMAALASLALRTNGIKGTTCIFMCAQPVLLHDNATATHLYRIAQEAVSNALRHAQAHHIEIKLTAGKGSIVLDVCDDGCGIAADSEDAGMGLKIMRYRAELIKARLTIETTPGSGTLVSCTLDKGEPKA
jgi:two-component system CheB/CheR fusion protein